MVKHYDKIGRYSGESKTQDEEERELYVRRLELENMRLAKMLKGEAKGTKDTIGRMWNRF